MSDAMTNREIEDVLTSIRRLVAQEGSRNAETGRLILTEAQRIVDEAGPVMDNTRPVSTEGMVPQTGETFRANVADAPDDTAPISAPLELFDPVIAGDADTQNAAHDDHGLPAPDFGQLEATIAELEAAVSGNAGNPDRDEDSDPAASRSTAGGSISADRDSVGAAREVPEAEDKGSNVTALYARLNFQHRRTSSTPPTGEGPFSTVPEQAAETDQTGQVAVGHAESADHVSEPENATQPAEVGYGASLETGPEPQDTNDGAEADGDDAAVAEETVIDEAMLRTVVAQLVREELHGQLGERITLQVRKLVRAEIAKALDERNYL
jgi:hypothetical protein